MEQNVVKEFLRQGMLPFVGREKELQEIISFWEGNFEGEGLRMRLLQGEAGVGKSRLMNEVADHIPSLGGTVLHLKVYPDTAMSLVTLLAGALREIKFLSERGERILSILLHDMKRLVRLRSVLMIVEDVHLLDEGAVKEFREVLNQLRDENLSIQLVARPGESRVKEFLEEHIHDEGELAGLNEGELIKLLEELGAGDRSKVIAGMVKQATEGNPLQCARRCGGVAGRIRSEEDVSQELFRGKEDQEIMQKIRQSATVYRSGLAVHLNQAEREGAEQLSWLGEVFAKRTGISILGEDGELMLESLIAKGMVSKNYKVVQPLTNWNVETEIYAFTHTLLHCHFLEESVVNAEAIVRVVHAKLPFYSILPFKLILQYGKAVRIPADSWDQICSCLSDVFLNTESRSMKAYAECLLNVIETLYKLEFIH